jgi:GLPGLI family protein
MTMMAFVFATASYSQKTDSTDSSKHVQTEPPDTAQLVAVYDYELKTQNDEGVPVTDKMQIVVQIGQKVTKSMPFSAYSRTEELEETDIVASYQEALMHMPTVWIGLPSGYTTVREFIFPREYDSTEETPEITWVLSKDTITVCGYFCQKATAMFRGVEWNVYYTEEIPSSAGPWRLSGLPGLIVEAKNEAHIFRLAELRQETSTITTPEQNPDVQRVKYEKLMKYRNEIYGNSKYAGNPLYYIAEFQNGTISLGGTINHMEVMNFGGKQYIYVDGHPLLTKAHVYQPLEGK